MTQPRIGRLHELTPTDFTQPPLITWKEFYGFRNHVMRVLRRFGSAGPMGEVDLEIEDEEEAPVFSNEIVTHPDFFVVDDMYNEHDKLSLVECNPVHLSLELLRAMVVLTAESPGWQVSFSLGDSGMRVGSNAILVGGRRFWDVKSLDGIAARCSGPVDYGASAPLPEPEYRFWLAMICGEFQPPTAERETGERQWVEAEDTLRRSIQNHPDRGLSVFDYDKVRYDLHPHTRRQLISRLLADHETLSSVISAGGVRNVETDTADTLRDLLPEKQATFAQVILIAGYALFRVAKTKESFLWWPNILYRLKGADASLRRTLIQELFPVAASSVSLTKLSSLFCLAMLRLDGLNALIDEAVKDSPDWTQNEPLMKWLGGLKRGYAGYPDREVFVELGLDGLVTRP
jgi:hypothetical protein